jgi:hypothetical protein
MSRIVVCLIVLLGSSATFSQKRSKDAEVIHFSDSNDVVYAKKGDGLPKEIFAKGMIVDAVSAGRSCGFLGGTGGALKIKLKERPRDYPHEFLYVAVLCFAGEDTKDFSGREVKLEVTKMTKSPYSFKVSWATLDSGGTPYYLAKVEGVGGLLQKITAEK